MRGRWLPPRVWPWRLSLDRGAGRLTLAQGRASDGPWAGTIGVRPPAGAGESGLTFTPLDGARPRRTTERAGPMTVDAPAGAHAGTARTDDDATGDDTYETARTFESLGVSS